MATQGDVHFTPFYDTTYGSFHGYNEKAMKEKHEFWSNQYQYHVPSASKIRANALVRNGFGDQVRALPQSSEVQQHLQQRTGLLGEANQTVTKNSLRISQRYGDVNPVKPTPSAEESAYASKHDAWLQRCLPATRIGDVSSSIEKKKKTSLPAATLRDEKISDVEDPDNPRQISYDTEYASEISNKQALSRIATTAPDFLQRSQELFATPLDETLHTKAETDNNPYSHELPVSTRLLHESINSPHLHAMSTPIHRKEYPDLDDRLRKDERPTDYNFDITYHINRMRPAPLFQNMRGNRRVKQP